MNNRARRRSSAILRRGATPAERIQMAHLIGARRAGQSWFKAAPRVLMTAGRASVGGVPVSVGTYAGAKQVAQESASAWMERELNRPTSSLNHRTVRVAGKPYHWRQDYTGQLKLGSGESPW